MGRRLSFDYVGTITTLYSRRCCMQKSIVVAFAALCLMGASSLALADDAMKGEMGKMI